MAIVTREVKIGQKPTEEQLKRINAAASKPITFDTDSPELTSDQLAEFRPANPEYYRPRKEQISIKLDSDVLAAFRATGRGYQTKINKILRDAVEKRRIK